MNREDCNRWLRRQVQEKARRVVLATVQCESRKGSEELLAFKIPTRPQDKWYKGTVRAVEDAVKRDMETLEHSSQPYSLVAYDGEGELMDRFPFREIDPDGETGLPVEPTNTGLTIQLMHHNRDLAKTMADMTKSVTSYYERTLAQLSESHAKMIDERLSTIEVVERLKSEEFERRLALKREESADETRSQLLARLMTLAPVVVAKLTGGTPSGPTESDHLLLSLVESLNPDQLERLMPILSPEQQVLILTLIEKFKRREESEPEKKSPPARVVEVVK